MGHSASDGGSSKSNGEAAATWILVDTRRPGNSPVLIELRAVARGVASGAGGAHSLAVRTKRNAGKRGAPKPCSRPLSDNRHAAAATLDGKRKGVKGTLAALLRLRPSRAARRRIAHHNSATPPPRGRVMQPRGEVDCIAFAGIRRVSAARAASRDTSQCPVGSGADAAESRRGDDFATPRSDGGLRTSSLTGGARRCARARAGSHPAAAPAPGQPLAFGGGRRSPDSRGYGGKRSRMVRVVSYEAATVSAQAVISARRLSVRSLLAYARSTALPTVWARHSSITAWSA